MFHRLTKVSKTMGRTRRLSYDSPQESVEREPVLADGMPICYFSSLDRDSAVTILSQFRVGTFLVRPSSVDSAAYTLSVRTEDQILNMRIYKTPQGEFHLDSSSRQLYFRDVSALLDYYSVAGRKIWVRNMQTMFTMDNALDSRAVNIRVLLNAAGSRGPLDSIL